MSIPNFTSAAESTEGLGAEYRATPHSDTAARRKIAGRALQHVYQSLWDLHAVVSYLAAMEADAPEGAGWERDRIADILRRHIQHTTQDVYGSMDAIADELGEEQGLRQERKL